MSTYTVEYYTTRYMKVTVEADDDAHALTVADNVITWGREPTSSTHELTFWPGKDWKHNRVSPYD